MPILLLLFPLPLLAAAFRLARMPWRVAMMSSAVLWGVWLAGLTEALSYKHGFAVVSVALGWMLFGCLSAGLLWIIGWRRAGRPRPLVMTVTSNPKKTIRQHALRGWRWATLFVDGLCLTPLGLGLLAIILTTLVIAVVSAPNNWDSMVYHMARVEHWIQNRSVANYPTNVPRQVHMPPWSEWAIAHTVLLAGNDRFANCVQWLAMVGSVIGASQIARRLGARGRGQLFAAISTATVPMGVMQASSTQNDYACAFWLVCCVALTLELFSQPRSQWRRGMGITLAILAGLAGGLALATKGTAYVYLPPLGVLLAIVGVVHWGWRAGVPLLIIPLVAPLPSLGFYHRNKEISSHYLGPGNEGLNVPESNKEQDNVTIYTNERPPFAVRYGTTWARHWAGLRWDFSILYSNAVRGLGDQMTLPDTRQLLVENPRSPSKITDANQWLAETITYYGFDTDPNEGERNRKRFDEISKHLRFYNIDPDDPATNWHHAGFNLWPTWNFEDGASEPSAVYAFYFAVITALLYWPKWPGGPRKRLLALGYACGVIGMFLVFSALLKWQPWHTRLHLPILILAGPLVGAALGAWPRALSYPLAAVLLLIAVPYAINMRGRPLTGQNSVLTATREETRFRNQPWLRERYVDMAETIMASGKTNVGLRIVGEDAWEYAFTDLFRDSAHEYRFEHVNVRNYTRVLGKEEPFKSFKPDWIVQLDGAIHLERVKPEIAP